ncbi:HNH endonuclease [Yersinia intermedia]|uniref:HNH endonuclease n=1 Tax=Yersinia intermedia TaxID=631 RepID=UPI0022FEEE50|nr:HNH endonuclease [Yersinia intermedia]MDA5479712.1 HNH endonuclease [Yersinia intermedia]
MKEKESFNDEHVIPDVLGGVYVINTVCKDCNSNLGSKVDIKIINEFASKIFRHNQNLKGKSGKLPIIFPSALMNQLDEKEKYRLENGDGGRITPKLIHSDLEIEALEKETYYVKMKFDDSMSTVEMQQQADKIISKEMKKRKLGYNIINSNIVLVKSEIKLSFDVDISSNDSFISVLKMAYEFSVSNLSGYNDDPQSHVIAGILENACYEEALNYVRGHNTFEMPVCDKFNVLFSLQKDRHILLLNNFEGKLGCMVYLKDIGFYCVNLSNKPFNFNSQFDGIVLINDVKEKKYEIISISDYIVREFR